VTSFVTREMLAMKRLLGVLGLFVVSTSHAGELPSPFDGMTYTFLDDSQEQTEYDFCAGGELVVRPADYDWVNVKIYGTWQQVGDVVRIKLRKVTGKKGAGRKRSHGNGITYDRYVPFEKDIKTESSFRASEMNSGSSFSFGEDAFTLAGKRPYSGTCNPEVKGKNAR
jgi:hypothetical protein